MHVYTAIIEKCADTGFYVAHIPDFPGAHTQGETLDEVNTNLREVLEMLLKCSWKTVIRNSIRNLLAHNR